MGHYIGKGTSFEGQIKPSAIEVDAYDQEVFAHRFTQIETNQQGFFDYVGGNSVIYAGYAAKGLGQSFTDPISGVDTGWLLQKFTYDGNGNVLSRQIAYGNWTNRASYTYA